MKHTKKTLKDSIKNLTFQECIDRTSKIERKLMMARFQTSISQNPYQYPDKSNSNKKKFDPRMLRYEKSLLCQRMTDMSRIKA